MSPGSPGWPQEGTTNPRFPGNRHSWESLVCLHTFPGLFPAQKEDFIPQFGAGAALPPLLWEFFHRESPSQSSFSGILRSLPVFSWHYGAIPVPGGLLGSTIPSREGEKQNFPQFLSSSSSRRIAREGAGQGQAPSHAGICWYFPPGLSRQVGNAGIWDPACPCHPPYYLVWSI